MSPDDLPVLTQAEVADESLRLVKLALHLRQYGECAPGGSETWHQFDTEATQLMYQATAATNQEEA